MAEKAPERAKYELLSDSYVDGVYHRATREKPARIELEADVEPSRKWVPLNEPAKAALRKLGVKQFAESPTPPIEGQEEPAPEADTTALGVPVAKRKDGRPNEKSPF